MFGTRVYANVDYSSINSVHLAIVSFGCKLHSVSRVSSNPFPNTAARN